MLIVFVLALVVVVGGALLWAMVVFSQSGKFARRQQNARQGRHTNDTHTP
jgi:hypothetical protein